MLDYEDLELPLVPDSVTGLYMSDALPELLNFCREYPEYHIVSCPVDLVLANRCIPGASLFYLAEGDSDAQLIHDPEHKVDEYLLQSLYSRFKSRFPNLIRSA